jgi:hypothetical protein
MTTPFDAPGRADDNAAYRNTAFISRDHCLLEGEIEQWFKQR